MSNVVYVSDWLDELKGFIKKAKEERDALSGLLVKQNSWFLNPQEPEPDRFAKLPVLRMEYLVVNETIFLAGENNWLKRLIRRLPFSERNERQLTRMV